MELELTRQVTTDDGDKVCELHYETDDVECEAETLKRDPTLLIVEVNVPKGSDGFVMSAHELGLFAEHVNEFRLAAARAVFAVTNHLGTIEEGPTDE